MHALTRALPWAGVWPSVGRRSYKNLLTTRIETQVRVYSERRAGTVPYSAQTCAPRRGARERARSTGPVACVVLTFTRMRTDQPLRRTVDGGLTHRRGSQGSGSPTNPPPPIRPDMCARVAERRRSRKAHLLHDILTDITFKPTHIPFCIHACSIHDMDIVGPPPHLQSCGTLSTTAPVLR